MSIRAVANLRVADWENLRKELESSGKLVEIWRSVECGSLIIHSLGDGHSRRGLRQCGQLATSLKTFPPAAALRSPAWLTRNGVQPVRIGRIPSQLAALMQTNINVQALTVEAVLKGDPELLHHAAMLDPHTAAELDLDQISSLGRRASRRPWRVDSRNASTRFAKV